jgi:hypothetical protein
MAYADVDTAFRATRASGDTYGRCEAALVRRAVTRIPSVTGSDDQREWLVCQAIIDGTFPASWVRLFMSLLDTAGQLAAPTDANLDTQASTVFDRIIKTRRV